MNIQIDKSDINEILWLQRAVEDVLLEETLKRSIEKGINLQENRFLFQEKIEYNYGEIEVSYSPRKSSNKRYESDRHAETYSLGEAIKLCLLKNKIE